MLSIYQTIIINDMVHSEHINRKDMEESDSRLLLRYYHGIFWTGIGKRKSTVTNIRQWTRTCNRNVRKKISGILSTRPRFSLVTHTRHIYIYSLCWHFGGFQALYVIWLWNTREEKSNLWKSLTEAVNFQNQERNGMIILKSILLK
jgi:hypothetical protein